MIKRRYGVLITACIVAIFAIGFEGPDIHDKRFSSYARAVAIHPQSTDSLAPKVFNSSLEARGGDIISIQGANFDSTTKVYQYGDARPFVLPIVNRAAANWIAVQLPASLAEPTFIQVANQRGNGPLLRLNAAMPQMLDTTQIVPGGKFRLLGRSLMTRGHHPTITIQGMRAVVDEHSSDETMLVATAPVGLKAESSVEVRCDNGNGTGSTALEGGVRVIAGSAGDPLDLKVGWAAGFSFSSRIVASGASCDGKTDDTQTIANSVVAASKSGGAVIELPPGTCRIAGTINLASNVILRGAGQDFTILRYEGNYPIFADGLDLVGLQNLQLRNSGQVQEGMVWRNNTRSFIQKVTVKMLVSRQWFFTSNRDFLFDQNVIEQTGSYDLQNPYRFDHSSGLIFSNSRTINVNGSPTFQAVHDSVFLNNQFTRDARSQNESTIVAHHSFAMDFAYRIGILHNKFDVANGPIENKTRNDGETLLVEGGGSSRTENIGSVESAGKDTVSDSQNRINVNPFGAGMPENLGIAIVSGSGAGQTRRIVAYNGSAVQVDRDWDVVPEVGSHYSTFVWGLEKALIKDNRLLDNPRGIWLYQSSVRDVLIQQNEIEDGGGIYLRSYQNVGAKMFTVQANIVISGNRVANQTGRWLSYIITAGVISGEYSFGIGQWGIEIRRNTLVANSPNVSSSQEEYASREGYTSLVHIEAEKAPGGPLSSVLGTIFQSNSCERCDHAFLIGAGDVGTVLVDNSPKVGSPNFILDVDLFGGASGGSVQTFIR